MSIVRDHGCSVEHPDSFSMKGSLPSEFEHFKKTVKRLNKESRIHLQSFQHYNSFKSLIQLCLIGVFWRLDKHRPATGAMLPRSLQGLFFHFYVPKLSFIRTTIPTDTTDIQQAALLWKKAAKTRRQLTVLKPYELKMRRRTTGRCPSSMDLRGKCVLLHTCMFASPALLSVNPCSLTQS